MCAINTHHACTTTFPIHLSFFIAIPLAGEMELLTTGPKTSWGHSRWSTSTSIATKLTTSMSPTSTMEVVAIAPVEILRMALFTPCRELPLHPLCLHAITAKRRLGNSEIANDSMTSCVCSNSTLHFLWSFDPLYVLIANCV